MVRWLMARTALAAGRSAGAQTRYAIIGCGAFGETTTLARAAADSTDFGGPAASASSEHVRECARLAAVIAESGRYRRMPLSGSMPVVAIAGVLKTITETVGPAGVVLVFLAAVLFVGVQGAAHAMVVEGDYGRTDDEDDRTSQTTATTRPTRGYQVVAHRPITRSEARKMKVEAEASTVHDRSWR
ncbi:hypothetical protein MMPV_007165 [Pyropia vietnamensis]